MRWILVFFWFKDRCDNILCAMSDPKSPLFPITLAAGVRRLGPVGVGRNPTEPQIGFAWESG